MRVDQLTPIVSRKQLFSTAKAKLVPEDCGCYVITTFSNEILYIGQAVNLRKRMSQHLENPAKTMLNDIGRAYYFYFLVLKGDLALNRLERGWLNMYELAEGKLPILNSVRAPL